MQTTKYNKEATRPTKDTPEVSGRGGLEEENSQSRQAEVTGASRTVGADLAKFNSKMEAGGRERGVPYGSCTCY